MPQLDPTWFASQLFWLAVTFVLLYGVLSRFVLPPLQDVMARRDQTVKDDIGQAQRSKSQAEQARQDYERLAAATRAQAQQSIADAQGAYKAKAETAGKELDKQIEQKLTEASKKIAAKKQELLATLEPAAAELTGMIVEKLTQHKPGSEQVNRILSQLSKGGS